LTLPRNTQRVGSSRFVGGLIMFAIEGLIVACLLLLTVAIAALILAIL